MGYRNRRIACIVVLGGLGLLAVLCQQWILSAREDPTESETHVANNFEPSEIADGHQLKAESDTVEWIMPPVVPKLVEPPFRQNEYLVPTDESFQHNSDIKLEHVDLSRESVRQEYILKVQDKTRTVSRAENEELLNIAWKPSSVTDKLLFTKSETDYDRAEHDRSEIHTDRRTILVNTEIAFGKTTTRASVENDLVRHDTTLNSTSGISKLVPGDGPAVDVVNMDAEEFANNNLLEQPLHPLPTEPAAVNFASSPSSSSKLLLVNVVSMSLYGSEPRYTFGAIRNAELIRQNFPGWQLWIYMESQSSSRFSPVPQDVIQRLVALGAEVHYITPEDDFVPPMMWRFLVADDPSVDRFIVRDVDSRLTRRDAAAVVAWVKSGRAFHCVRDHPSHAGYAVSGGMWGGRAPMLHTILRRSWASMMRGIADGYLDDMNFLNNVIWLHLTVERDVYCSDSVSCDRWAGAFPFPVSRHNYEHVGQVYDESDRGRGVDMQILRDTPENQNCIPNHL